MKCHKSRLDLSVAPLSNRPSSFFFSQPRCSRGARMTCGKCLHAAALDRGSTGPHRRGWGGRRSRAGKSDGVFEAGRCGGAGGRGRADGGTQPAATISSSLKRMRRRRRRPREAASGPRARRQRRRGARGGRRSLISLSLRVGLVLGPGSARGGALEGALGGRNRGTCSGKAKRPGIRDAVSARADERACRRPRGGRGRRRAGGGAPLRDGVVAPLRSLGPAASCGGSTGGQRTGDGAGRGRRRVRPLRERFRQTRRAGADAARREQPMDSP
jgi:hypothetical protein